MLEVGLRGMSLEREIGGWLGELGLISGVGGREGTEVSLVREPSGFGLIWRNS